MRILHLSWEYPPIVYGGLGRHVHALAEMQASLGHEVVVLTQGEGIASGSAVVADEVVNSVRVVRVVPDAPGDVDWRVDFQQWAFGFNIAVARTAIRLGREWTPDVVHGHDWLVGQAAVVAREALGAPFVLTVHATESGRMAGRLATRLSHSIHASEDWTVGQADGVIVCSRAMRSEVSALFGVDVEDVRIIPNGISPDRWLVPGTPAADEVWLDGHERIVFAGRLEDEKGVGTLLDAMPLVNAEFPSARLLVIGEGGAEARLRHHASQVGLAEDHVRFAGHVSESELRRLVGTADAAVVPSLYEPFGFVAIEAAILGAPLVVSDVGGLADIVIDGRTGLLVAPGSPQALAMALLEVLSDRPAAGRRASAARMDVIDRFSWEAIALQTIDAYASARVSPHDPRAAAGGSR